MDGQHQFACSFIDHAVILPHSEHKFRFRDAMTAKPLSSNPLSAESNSPAHPRQGGAEPRLLVSVRNPQEAISACLGGCHLIDIKEPLFGPLGMATPGVISQIVTVVRAEFPEVILSSALGEVVDWRLQSPPAIDAPLDFVKLGCASLQSSPDWRSEWLETRQRWQKSLPPGTGWVAVAYADWQVCAAPDIRDILDLACDSDCQGVLIDTAIKAGRTLLDCLDDRTLTAISRQVQECGKFLALAGSLNRKVISKVSVWQPDYFAIRGAACRQGNRTSTVDRELVQQFLAEMMRCVQHRMTG